MVLTHHDVEVTVAIEVGDVETHAPTDEVGADGVFDPQGGGVDRLFVPNELAELARPRRTDNCVEPAITAQVDQTVPIGSPAESPTRHDVPNV
jgi:hypothetical protein